jgi:hypothetical protein
MKKILNFLLLIFDDENLKKEDISYIYFLKAKIYQ